MSQFCKVVCFNLQHPDASTQKNEIVASNKCGIYQGSKIVLVRSYLQVSQAAGQVNILIFLVKIKFSPMFANKFCDAGQVPIFRYFEACICWGYDVFKF